MKTIFEAGPYRVETGRDVENTFHLYIWGHGRVAHFMDHDAMGIDVAFEAIRQMHEGDTWEGVKAGRSLCASLLVKHGY